MHDSSTSPFWEERYQAKRTPWDFHGTPAAFNSFLSRSKKQGRVLVPGCGSAYEVKAFLDHGWDAYGIDFSPTAVQQAQKMLGKKSDCILCGDFFNHVFEKPFDLVYERAFLCALPPHVRKAYAKRIGELLLPKGCLVGYFFYGAMSEGPPYPLKNLDEAKQLLNGFQLCEDLVADDSLPIMKGKECWQEWRKLAQCNSINLLEASRLERERSYLFASF